jgi:hypothetical protein
VATKSPHPNATYHVDLLVHDTYLWYTVELQSDVRQYSVRCLYLEGMLERVKYMDFQVTLYDIHKLIVKCHHELMLWCMLCTTQHFPKCCSMLIGAIHQWVCSTCNRNVVFWVKEMPHFTVKLKCNPPSVMMYTGMTASDFIGTYSFDGPAQATSHANVVCVVNTTP